MVLWVLGLVTLLYTAFECWQLTPRDEYPQLLFHDRSIRIERWQWGRGGDA